LPFEDNFDRALRSDWEILEGDWRIVNARLSTLSRNKEWSRMLLGEPHWRDYAVEVQPNLERPGDGIRVMVRVQDANNMMVFFAQNRGQSGWWLWKDGEQYLLVKGDQLYRTSPKIRVDVKDDLYTAYVDGQRWLSINDSTFETGRVGLGLYCDSGSNCNSVEYFKVEALPD